MYLSLSLYTYIYIYNVYIDICISEGLISLSVSVSVSPCLISLSVLRYLDLRGFNSSRSLISRGGILRPIRDFPETLSQANLSRDSLSREIRRTCSGGRDGVFLQRPAYPDLVEFYRSRSTYHLSLRL